MTLIFWIHRQVRGYPHFPPASWLSEKGIFPFEIEQRQSCCCGGSTFASSLVFSHYKVTLKWETRLAYGAGVPRAWGSHARASCAPAEAALPGGKTKGAAAARAPLGSSGADGVNRLVHRAAGG